MKDDLISRQAAIAEFSSCELTPDGGIDANYAIDFLKQMPQAQPDHIGEVNEMVGDTILRAKAIDAVRKARDKSEAHRRLVQLPPAQPSVSKEEMVGDTISRQAAIKAICEDGTMLERQGKYTMTMAERKQKDADILDSLPSAQPGWIPVTKRLPKPKEYVNGVRKYYLVQNEYGDMMVCSWDGCFWKQMYRTTHVKDKVAAWMPLPAPYIPEGDDKHEG